MRVGLRLPSYAWPDATYDGVRRLGAYARQAEARGFDSLWVIEHLLVSPALYGVAWHDPLLVLAHVAAVTERARLGTAILVLPLRHPAIVAREVISLDFLSGGRFILGVGTGWLLWAVGTAFWLLGKVVLSTPRARAPHAWAWWDRITRAWVLVVLVWGIVASLAVLVVGILIDRLAA